MIIENFITKLLATIGDSQVKNIRDVQVKNSTHRGNNLLIEFENGFCIRIDGYISIENSGVDQKVVK